MKPEQSQNAEQNISSTPKRSWASAIFARVRAWLRLDTETMLHMLKGSLPPVIVIAMYQATAIANIEYTFGYLAAILTVSAQCLLPRAKFIKILFFSVLSSSIGAAISCIAVVCCVRARQESTSADGSETDTYDSSASAVSAVWLLFGIWIANAFRAFRPSELQDPMVALSIFLVVSLTSTPSFLTIYDGVHFVRRLLITFLIGLAVAAGVSLFILPITSRRNIFGAYDAFICAVDDHLAANIAYVMEERTSSDPLSHKFSRNHNSQTSNVKSKLSALRGVLAKISSEMVYAKTEPAWGKLLPEDLIAIQDHLESLFLPLAGLGLIPEVVQALRQLVSKQNMYSKDITGETVPDTPNEPSWENLIAALEARLASTKHLTSTGLRVAFQSLDIHGAHVNERLNKDLESQGAQPHSVSLSETFLAEVGTYKDRRRDLHNFWPSLMFPSESNHKPDREIHGRSGLDSDVREHLLVFLFMEQIQNEVVQAVHDLVIFASQKEKSGCMLRNRLILPDCRKFGAGVLLANILQRSNVDDQNSIFMATHPWETRNAEHMPPTNWFERFGNRLRVFPRLLTCTFSVFGARVALATISVAILAYIRQTQAWFNEQRIIWVLVVIVIGMKPEAGASTFGYLARIGGTAISLILSLIVWYIVDGHTAGVLVFLYFANVFEYYFWVRYPQYLGPCTIMIVTLNVIIAYELLVSKLGVETATSNGQPYLPMYLFGPYKLLSVIVAVTISYFWTIFPAPLSARSQVRTNLGRGLFLLANYYSCMHKIVKQWMNDAQGDWNDSRSPGRQLQALARPLFSEQMGLLGRTRSLIHWTAYEIPLGGKFPKAAYVSAVSNIQMLVTCMALMIRATRDINFATPNLTADVDSSTNPDSETAIVTQDRWITQLAHAADSTDFDAHKTASLLCHLAGSMYSNSALPPYLSPAESFPLARKLREVNAQAMQMNSIQDSSFSASACMEVSASLMAHTLRHLIENVKSLVGEIDFDTNLGTGRT